MIDIPKPSDKNNRKEEYEKLKKHQELNENLKKMWKMKNKI